MKKQIVTGALAAVLASTGLFFGAVQPASASQKSREKAWRIGTYVGAAGTGYALSRGKGTWALIGAGATLLSYSQWKKEVNRRHERDRSYAAYKRYRSSWYARRRSARR